MTITNVSPDQDLLPTPADSSAPWPLSRRGRVGARVRQVLAVLLTIGVPVAVGVALVEKAGMPRLLAAVFVVLGVVAYAIAFRPSLVVSPEEDEDEDAVA